MISIKQKELKQLKSGEITQKDFAQKLIETYPVKAIAEALVELLATADNVYEIPKIPIFKEMFEAHFRLIGYNSDGSASTRERKPIDYLTEREISALKEAKIDNESLCAVRDAFLLQVYSGLSYIDLEHLRKEDIKIAEDGTHYIKKPRVKTGIEYTAIILPDGIEILKRNNYQLKVISNQKMNLYLKTVMTLAGIEHNLVTHLGRKTYGHILLNSGVRLEVVAKNLGHSSSKTTAKFYAELTTDTVLQETKAAF